MLTAPQAQALRIVADHPNITGRQFADLMWPKSPGHNRVHRCGAHNTGVAGAPMWRAAGAYLAKLTTKGWLRCDRTGPPAYQPFWRITVAGLRELIAFTAPTTTTGSFVSSGKPPGTFIREPHRVILRGICDGGWLFVGSGQPVRYYLGRSGQEAKHVATAIIMEMMAWGWLDDHLMMTPAARKRMGLARR